MGVAAVALLRGGGMTDKNLIDRLCAALEAHALAHCDEFHIGPFAKCDQTECKHDRALLIEAPTIATPDEVAKWLCDIGYGVDWCNREHPLPEALREPLAMAWRNYDQPYEGGPTVSDYMDMLEAEGIFGSEPAGDA